MDRPGGQPLPPLDLDTKRVPGVRSTEDLAIAAEGRWGPRFGSPCSHPPSSRPGASIYSVTVFVRGAPSGLRGGVLLRGGGTTPSPLPFPPSTQKLAAPPPTLTLREPSVWGRTWTPRQVPHGCWGCTSLLPCGLGLFPPPCAQASAHCLGWLRTGGASGGSCSQETSGDPQTPQICCWGVFGARPCPWGGPAC